MNFLFLSNLLRAFLYYIIHKIDKNQCGAYNLMMIKVRHFSLDSKLLFVIGDVLFLALLPLGKILGILCLLFRCPKVKHPIGSVPVTAVSNTTRRSRD